MIYPIIDNKYTINLISFFFLDYNIKASNIFYYSAISKCPNNLSANYFAQLK